VAFKRPPNLFGCRVKIGRAQHHLDTLREHIEAFLEGHRYVVHAEPDTERGCYVARLKNPPAIPAPEWALMIGDCVHNARASLDYIAWELAGADPADMRTQFPIFRTIEGYRARGERRVAALPQEARTLMEKLQPYQTDDPAKHVLWVLHELDAADKHKLLTVTAVMAEGGQFGFQIPDGVDIEDFRLAVFPDAVLGHDAVIGEIHVGSPIPEVTVQLEITPSVAFGEILGWGRRMFVVQNLQRIIDEVEGIEFLFRQRLSLRDA
jgi:hypothetical protein